VPLLDYDHFLMLIGFYVDSFSYANSCQDIFCPLTRIPPELFDTLSINPYRKHQIVLNWTTDDITLQESKICHANMFCWYWTFPHQTTPFYHQNVKSTTHFRSTWAFPMIFPNPLLRTQWIDLKEVRVSRALDSTDSSSFGLGHLKYWWWKSKFSVRVYSNEVIVFDKGLLTNQDMLGCKSDW